MWRFRKNPDREAAAQEMKEHEAVQTIDRVIHALKTLKSKEGFITSLSRKANALRVGALFIGLMVPRSALAYGPHQRVEELNDMIQGVEKYQDKLRKKQAMYEQKGEKKHAYQIRQLEHELDRSEALQQRLEKKRDRTKERVEKAHVKRSDRVEKIARKAAEKPGVQRAERLELQPLELYYSASPRVDAYLQHAGVQEQGRNLVVTGADGEQKFIHVPYEYEVYGFDYDGGDELTIIMQNSDGSYYGIFFDKGVYAGEGKVNKRGSKI